MTANTVIVLGAGASAADGAPIQSNLFRDYFTYKRSQPAANSRNDWDTELSTFFAEFFGIDVVKDDMTAIEFPTFEEILGILEIADSQGESFPGLVGPHLADEGAGRLQRIHDLLVFSIAETLHHKLNGPRHSHDRLLVSLSSAGTLATTAFISFNYDLLIDNALLEEVGDGRTYYGVRFANQAEPDSPSSRRRPIVPLYKLHGSLNWLFCPTCRDLHITPHEKGVMRIRWQPRETHCDRCSTPRTPIVIPPTFFKVLSNLFLRTIWDAAERTCLDADRIVFCGYSLPDADVHVRYLLKRVERLRRATPQIFVVNHHDGKNATMADGEKGRYRRFFVDKSAVHYTDVSFEEFADRPEVIEDRSRWL